MKTKTEKRWAEYYPDSGNLGIYDRDWTKADVLDFRRQQRITDPLIRVTLTYEVPE